MVFEVSRARREILQKLAEADWTPTELAEELGKSPSTVYNHLDDLHSRGIVQKRQVAGTTRPATEYSVGEGFLQYVSVLPEGYTERTVSLTPDKRAILQIWNLPQAEFHPFVEQYWWLVRENADVDFGTVRGIAVYGSVARGTADADSDIDVLVITEDDASAALVRRELSPVRLDAGDATRIAMAEVYPIDEYRESIVSGSEFLGSIRDELYVVYDPVGVFRNGDTEQ